MNDQNKDIKQIHNDSMKQFQEIMKQATELLSDIRALNKKGSNKS